MADYVNRFDLRNALYDADAVTMRGVKMINEFPAADVAPVRHGHWIEDGDVQICSECGEEHEWADYRAPYCDTCGAKMDGGQSRLVSVTTRQPDEWKSVLTCVTRKCVTLPEPPKEET